MVPTTSCLHFPFTFAFMDKHLVTPLEKKLPTSSSLLVLTSSRYMCDNHCIVLIDHQYCILSIQTLILQSFKLFLQKWFRCSIIFRIAKKKLDNRSFFGGILHVCYAPEFETVDDTREKLQERRKIIAKKTRGDWAHQLRL